MLVGDFSFNLKMGSNLLLTIKKSNHCQQQDTVLFLLLAQVQFSYLSEVTLKNVLVCD